MYTNKKIVSALLGASIASRALKVISSLLLIIIMCANASLWSAEWSADWDSLDGWDANSEEYCDLTHCLPVGAASESFGPCDSRDMRSGLKDPLLSSVNRNRGTKRNQDDEYFFPKRAPAPDGTFYPSAASLCPDQLTELSGGQQEASAQAQEETDGNVDVATALQTAATRDQSWMGEQPLKCYRGGCCYIASDKKDLIAHRRTHSPDELYECDFNECNYASAQASTLATHRRTHTGENPFKCDFNKCNYASAQAINLARHKRKHTGEKPYECDFNGCTYTAAQSSDVTKHRRIHSGEKPYECGIDGCTYTTARSDTLKTHQKTHAGEKPFVSGVASKALLPSPQVQSPNLRPMPPQHFPESSNALDSNLSPLVVDPADWDTTNCVDTPNGLEVANDDHWPLDLIDFNNSLKANAGLRPDADVDASATDDGNVDVVTAPQTAATRDQSWMGEQPLKCYRGGCCYIASDKKDLSAHRRTHSPDEKYTCDFPTCRHRTAQLGNLNTHIRTHTGERPYECGIDECTYTTAQQGNLIAHRKTHTGKKTYECGIDGCTYTTAHLSSVKSHRKTHRKTHTGEKLYECGIDECDYASADRSNLIVHRKTHTGEKPYECDWEECTYRTVRASTLKRHKITHTGEKPFASGVAGKALLPSPQVQSPDLRPILVQQVPESSNSLDSNLSPLVVDPADWDATNYVDTSNGLEVANDDHWPSDLISFNNYLKANAGLRPDADVDASATDDGNVDVVTAPQTAATRDQSWMGEQPLKCYRGGCCYIASDKKDLIAHRKRHSPGEKYTCDFNECNYASAQASTLAIHRRTHTGENPFKCDFNKCNYASAQASTLARHKRKHTGKKPYECDAPGKALLPSPQVQSPNLCPMPPQHLLENGLKAIVNETAVDGNVDVVTAPRTAAIRDQSCMGEQPSVSGIDGRPYATTQSNNLASERKTHTGREPFVCRINGCGHVAHNPTILAIHINSKHPGEKPFKCDWEGCTYKTANIGTLKYHIESHKAGVTSAPRAAETRNQKCGIDGCTYTSAQAGRLAQHRKNHTCEKPYKCDFNGCTFETIYSGNLTIHKRKHTGEKPFVCGAAGKALLPSPQVQSPNLCPMPPQHFPESSDSLDLNQVHSADLGATNCTGTPDGEVILWSLGVSPAK